MCVLAFWSHEGDELVNEKRYGQHGYLSTVKKISFSSSEQRRKGKKENRDHWDHVLFSRPLMDKYTDKQKNTNIAQLGRSFGAETYRSPVLFRHFLVLRTFARKSFYIVFFFFKNFCYSWVMSYSCLRYKKSGGNRLPFGNKISQRRP